MPRGGSKPGERRGGKQKGTLNKATRERLALAVREVQDAKRQGRKLAKEVLDDLMHTALGRAAYYQPAAGDQPAKAHADEDKFMDAMRLAGYFAKCLAPYQSPTFKAIQVHGSLEVNIPAQPAAGGNVITLDDPVAIARVYQNTMRQVK